jgi:mRNA interferase MazF
MDRGDLIWISFDPQAGHEQAGRRPALVLSPEAYNNRVGLALMCPITSRRKGYAFEVELPADSAVTGVILTDQIRSFDWQARRAEVAGQVPAEIVEDVLAKLRTLL